jgi:hypothetical protein
MEADYIARKLSWINAELRLQEIEDGEILHTFSAPLVILGDPGMGKTRLMEKLGEQSGCRFIRAVSFLRQPNYTTFGTDRLIIDGLDEVAAIAEDDPLQNVLAKLVGCGAPQFIISCRSIEWRSATARIDIADEYGEVPQELTLLALSQSDAIASLSARVGADRAKEAVFGLEIAGLAELYENPLTLNFVAAIVAEEGDVPRSRAHLYDRAVSQLRKESNDRHLDSTLARLSEDDALDAAGALFAAMLITGRGSLSIGRPKNGSLSISELSDIANADNMRAVLGSNLYRTSPQHPGEFLPMHRTIAEFLGARWLARRAESNSLRSRTTHRLLGLISAEGGVPASLRGLHSWLPRFSPVLIGPGAINRDPYGILRYGDGDGLDAQQARSIICGLRQLARFDPFFRTDWRETIALKGLAQAALKDDLRAIITSKSEPFQLRSLILEAVNGSDIAAELRDDLERILVTPSHDFFERKESAEALSKIGNSILDWGEVIEQLISFGDEDSTRLAVELPSIVDAESIPDELIAEAVAAHSGVLDPKPNRPIAFGSLYSLGRGISTQRIAGVLDALAALIAPTRDPEKWWDNEYWEGSFEFASFVDALIRRQLEHDALAVSPASLWNWMSTLQRERDGEKDDRQAIARILKGNERLRRGVQSLALFNVGKSGDWFSRRWHLERLSGLGLTDRDARTFLTKVVAKNDRADREAWMALVSHFRKDGVVPQEIRKLARPFARGDKELSDFLTRTPKSPKLDEWERKHRQRTREQERSKLRSQAKARKTFGTRISEIRRGDLGWILAPARAYLGFFTDLREEENPSQRIANWLGDEIRDAAVQGFESTLHRPDLPSADQISESYADSKIWNYVHPMLAGAVERKISGRGFVDLNPKLLSGIAIAAEHELISPREHFEKLKDTLEDQIRTDPQAYEVHIRRKFEPAIRKLQDHVWGLYQFARSEREQPLSTRLCLEWLETYSDLPLEIERELAGCALRAQHVERGQVMSRLADITEKRLEKTPLSDDAERYWRSIHFLTDFAAAIQKIPTITRENRDWLWAITSAFYWRFGSSEGAAINATIDQLKWVVSTFRSVWPYAARPTGVTQGDQNPWDASRLLEWAMYEIAKDPSDEAAKALAELRASRDDAYSTILQSAIAANHRVRLETQFQSPELSEFKSIFANLPPTSAADVQAIILSELEQLQARLAGDPLNLVNNFYTDAGTPRGENACRDQMLIALGQLPYGILVPPEAAMPQGRFSDAAFTYHQIAVPLEAKGQWHRDLWTAASSQLDGLYSVDHKAASKGIYVVFWFGPKAPRGKRLRGPPGGIARPTSSEELRLALWAGLPAHRRDDIAVVVLDVTRP